MEKEKHQEDWENAQAQAQDQAQAEPGSFQMPHRVLGKLTSTGDSAVPGVNITITEQLTSWGRGSLNTIIHANPMETRIPKYAFKVFVWTPLPDVSGPLDFTKQQDYGFYISTKSNQGILINGVPLKSDDPKRVCMPSKHWVELRQEDVIQVWSSGNQFTKLHFDCYWGVSRLSRPHGIPPVTTLSEAEAEDIDWKCYEWERDFLDARDEDKKKKKGAAAAAAAEAGKGKQADEGKEKTDMEATASFTAPSLLEG